MTTQRFEHVAIGDEASRWRCRSWLADGVARPGPRRRSSEIFGVGRVDIGAVARATWPGPATSSAHPTCSGASRRVGTPADDEEGLTASPQQVGNLDPAEAVADCIAAVEHARRTQPRRSAGPASSDSASVARSPSGSPRQDSPSAMRQLLAGSRLPDMRAASTTADRPRRWSALGPGRSARTGPARRRRTPAPAEALAARRGCTARRRRSPGSGSMPGDRCRSRGDPHGHRHRAARRRRWSPARRAASSRRRCWHSGSVRSVAAVRLEEFDYELPAGAHRPGADRAARRRPAARRPGERAARAPHRRRPPGARCAPVTSSSSTRRG